MRLIFFQQRLSAYHTISFSHMVFPCGTKNVPLALDQLYRKIIVIFDGYMIGKRMLEKDQTHHYVSGVNLKTEMGKMEGFYIFERPYMQDYFEVRIPAFELWAPCKHN
jgi:hypothetical protein